MNVYFVRMAADRQVVGIFVAANVKELAGIVEECCSPLGTEYALMPAGGYFVEDATDASWPARDDGEDILEVDREPLAGGSLSEAWLRHQENAEWFPIGLFGIPGIDDIYTPGRGV